VELNEYRDYEEARRPIGRFIDEVYLTKRIHSSLGYLTPAEFEAQW
jgi:transposase InsO family protein